MISALKLNLKNHLNFDSFTSVSLPVANAPGEVKTGLIQVSLEAGLPRSPTTLRTNIWGFVFMDPLVGGDGARVREHHWR